MQKRDVGSAAIGAALSAAAFVAVYEGKVSVSHAGQTVELAPGEAARASEQGVEKVSADEALQHEDDPAMSANKNLAESVRDYKRRLETIESQKTKLEKQLAEAQQKLALQNDASIKSEYDLSTEDWIALSKENQVRFRVPCQKPWNPSTDDINTLGLAPQDASVLKEAWARSNERVWSGIKPLCGQAVGSLEVAEKIGPNTCLHLIIDIADKENHESTRQAFKDVGEIRGGLKPMPDKPSAPLQALMLMTGEMKSVEADLAKSLGPDEARRLVFSDGKGMCLASSRWGL
jgi:hypothetical protein